jgi:TetR/AcrR family transcriptional repressor of nem operon
MSLKEKIVHESLKLFSLKGFLSTSIDEILKATNASKGGFYNHFKSKEDLFYHVLNEARSIWRNRNLKGLSRIEDPIKKIKQLIANYRDNYIKDSENFPGGCIFTTLLLELCDQRPHLAHEINKGFLGVKRMLKQNLDQGKELGKLRKDANTEAIANILFNSMLGASVTYNAEKSATGLDASINPIIDYLEQLEV